MDKIIAKIDEAFEKLTSMKILDAINALIKYLGEALSDFGEEEAGDILNKIYKFGD